MNPEDHEKAHELAELAVNTDGLHEDIVLIAKAYLDYETRLGIEISRSVLAEEYIQSLCDKAESGDQCLLCGEVFAESNTQAFPDCPVPGARDFLADPEAAAKAVERAAKRSET